MSVKISKKAALDLALIAETGLLEYGEEQTYEYMNEFDLFFQFLAAFPKAGNLRSEIKPPVRVFVHKPYLVVYSEMNGGVLIQRVLHQRFDWKETFFD